MPFPSGNGLPVTSPLRFVGGFLLALLVFLYFIGIPSTQAAGLPSLQDALLDGDEIEPAEDKDLLPQTDDQPDMAGNDWLPFEDSYPRQPAQACAPRALASFRPSCLGTRAPPIV